MTHTFKEFSTKALFKLGNSQCLSAYAQARQVGLYTFIWASSNPIDLIIDSVPFILGPNCILALTPIQYIEYLNGDDAILYQFNREFYCIREHDKELSCAGMLFFGNTNIPKISLNNQELQKFKTLHEVFLDELNTKDNIQGEMLRMLMARFIIKCTRLLKNQEGFIETPKSSKVDLLRSFNLLVEEHFKDEHGVAFYADKLIKSPKTLSNNFAKLSRSPLQIIHQRIILEAKRLLTYSNMSTKEIAFEVGFEDASHLSRLFKKHTKLSPSEFKKGLKAVS